MCKEFIETRPGSGIRICACLKALNDVYEQMSTCHLREGEFEELVKRLRGNWTHREILLTENPKHGNLWLQEKFLNEPDSL